MSRLPVKSGISSPTVTSIPEKWDREWFRYFISNFLSYADTRNSIGSPNAQISGNINTPATIQTIGGMPPIFLDNGDGGGDGDALIVPGPQGPSGASSISAFRSSSGSSTSTTLTADATLVLNLNSPGDYVFEMFLPIYQNVSGLAGFKFDLNSGSATLTSLSYAVIGFSAGITSRSTVTQVLSISNSSTAPSWLLAKGLIIVSAAGTVGLRWAQNTLDATNATVVASGAYMVATKIG